MSGFARAFEGMTWVPGGRCIYYISDDRSDALYMVCCSSISFKMMF
jgi:hypothetical protein